MQRPDHENEPQSPAAHAADGNGTTFAAHYQQARQTLWVIAAGIASPAAAADIVQQAAVEALAKHEQFEPGTNFTAWMAQFVRYVALNHVRAQQRKAGVPLSESHPPAAAPPEPPPPAELTERGQLPADQACFDDAVTRALQSLPETARACLLLRTVQEMSYAEIARTLGIPEGTAMSHVHRSRQHLRTKLHQPPEPVGKRDAQR